MITGNEIRRVFLDYFAKNDHTTVESSPLVPRNDPTLMFTNAGMVQFKNVFTGSEKRPYTKAATSQKCVRAGGKHNDLENVGYTTRHHTFFEMMGNFSFGDYFKDVAIEHAWNLITKEYEVPEEKLLVTVYSEDEEAAALWRKIAGISDDRIIRIPTSDNFWSMGPTGPCGPCSEIFYDHGDKIFGGPPGSPDEDGDRFVEIWNLVFMQYEQIDKDTRIDLPKPSIDTGMGLERITAILQGKHDNYDIDLLRTIIDASAHETGVDADGDHAISHRVIADHLRSTAFLIADGVLPSNEGRGYVLRRIMRRAMRHMHKIGVKDPTVYKLVPSLVQMMGTAFPELARAEALISETLKLEENRFGQTLDRGMRLLSGETDKIGDKGTLNGEVAFKLYDTYGFPLDLTQDVLRGQGQSVDVEGFNTAMEQQRAAARKAWSGSGDVATEKVWFELQEKFGGTEFLGYDTETAEGQILTILKDGKEVQTASAGDQVMIIANQTPFYGESGGQQGDHGLLFSADGAEVAIRDTQKKLGNVFVHIGEVVRGEITPNAAVEMKVDGHRRSAIRAHHSATHLLHEALRRQLGTHVTQKGSLVAKERLRFDVSHPKSLEANDIIVVETEVNERIRDNAEVKTRLMTPDEAIKEGAMALFGEKYGEEVRVVSMGGADSSTGSGYYSTELCGGTHVRRTGDIGFFKIISESALASGVRRIEAVTGQAALEHVSTQESQLSGAAAAIKASPAELETRVSSLLEERKRLERELTDARRKLAASGGSSSAAEEFKDVNGIKFAPRILNDVLPKDLKPTADELKKQIGSGVIVLIADTDGKASIVVAVTDDLTDKISAVDLVRAGSAALGGKGGGGRPDMAQAGGPDASKAPEAITAIEALIG
ncbi:alanine--tRNA ligase [Kiloniella sp.]|uniref:alanine--tRNA ligase n=1 Tax=Kiloniella sp. TaxID=1938587 RepID=UPI003B01B381